jgi:hypothetical protein
MFADLGEASSSLLLAILATYFVMQSGRRKLAYITIVAMHNLNVEYGRCTVKQTYGNVLKNVLRLLMVYEFRWPSLI